MTYTTTLTAGRNVKNKPLTDKAWNDAVDSLTFALTNLISDESLVIEKKFGVATWQNDDESVVEEESVVVTARHDKKIRSTTVEKIGYEIRLLLFRYNQEAVAFTSNAEVTLLTK